MLRPNGSQRGEPGFPSSLSGGISRWGKKSTRLFKASTVAANALCKQICRLSLNRLRFREIAACQKITDLTMYLWYLTHARCYLLPRNFLYFMALTSRFSQIAGPPGFDGRSLTSAASVHTS